MKMLPCPFCGLKARINQAENDPAWWIVECSHQDCEVCPSLEREGREVAIAAWNKRGEVRTTAGQS